MGALFTASCLGGDPNTAPSTPAAVSDKTVSVYNTALNDSLNPMDSLELAGTRVLFSLYGGLVYLTPDGLPELDVASALESSDNKTWRVRLRPDAKFSDGTPVTAKSFVDAWNFTADKSNGLKRTGRFSSIVGHGEGKEMSGLTVQGDHEFTIELKAPDRSFREQLGSATFLPLPASAFADMKAFGRSPIGNGPYQLVKWTPGVEIVLERNPEYKGPRAPKNGGITYRVYANPLAAYNDLLSGALDVLDAFPDSALSSWQQELQGRSALRDIASSYYLVIPHDDSGFPDSREGRLRRRAISRAIDRAAISENIFRGTRIPAHEFTAPVIPGYDANLFGSEVFKHDATEAKKLWEEANGYSAWDRELVLNYANDRGDKESFDALAHQISNALGISVRAEGHPTFPAARDAGLSRHQPLRLSWVAGWPSTNYYLQILYTASSPSNISGWSSSSFDQLLKTGDAATTEAAALHDYRQAQEILIHDLPVLPLFYGKGMLGWSENIASASSDWQGIPVYTEIAPR